MIKNKKIEYKLKLGSLTVEAAFLVPLVLLMVFLILLYGMYEHQRIWYLSAAYEAALSKGDVQKKTQQRQQDAALSQERLECKISETKQQIQVRFEGGMLPFMGKNLLEFKVKGTASYLEPVFYIRRIRLAEKAFESGKGEG